MAKSGFIHYSYTPCRLAQTVDITALHTAFVHHMDSDYSSESESHNFWEIIVVLEGDICVVTGEHTFLLPQNTMLLHPPLEFHRHFNPNQQKNTYAVISFSADAFPVSQNFTYTLSPADVAEFRAIIRLIRDQYVMDKICVLEKKTTARPSIDQEVKSRLEYFLSTVLFTQATPFQNTSNDYQRIVSYLTKNLHRKMTVPMIAQALEMSPANLKRVFSLYSKMGIIKYFNQLKFQKATELLCEGYSVREVSEMLAFTSQSVFSTAFKKATGLPPSGYKRT